jgi:hypothetical protein
VYGANGRSDGAIRRPDEPAEKAVPLRRHDFRFRPATGEFQVVSGFSQFGLPRDDLGNRFPSWNTIPIRHVTMEETVLSRNPHLAESSSVATILDPADGGRVFPISPAQTTFNRESTAYFNATCGPTIYRGDLLDSAYRAEDAELARDQTLFALLMGLRESSIAEVYVKGRRLNALSTNR